MTSLYVIIPRHEAPFEAFPAGVPTSLLHCCFYEVRYQPPSDDFLLGWATNWNEAKALITAHKERNSSSQGRPASD